MMRRAFLVLWLGLVGWSGAHAQESCGWLEPAELDRLLPQAAPWSVMVGGQVGSCKFIGRGRGGGGPTIIGANQMFKASAAEASGFVNDLRAPMQESYRVESVPGLGEHGFRYLPRDAGGSASSRSVSYVGHHQKVAITGQLVLPLGANLADYEAGAGGFMRAALAVGDDATVAAASQCRWFDEAIVRRMLPGDKFSQQAFGENSCMAQNGTGAALVLSIQQDVSPQVAAALQDNSCTWTALADLGPGAAIGSGCQGGRPRASVVLAVENRWLNYTLAPGREPTDAERELLVAHARAVAAAAR